MQEHYWQTVLKAISWVERRNNIPAKISHQYPQTFEEARRKYASAN